MARKNFNDGQEIVFEDLTKISAAIERGLYDRFFYEMLLRASDSFFSDSFLVEYVNPNTVSVRPGLGVQEDLAAVSPEPEQRPLVLGASENVAVASPHPSLDRIDIICVKAEIEDEITESRKFKNASTSVISNENLVVQTDWAADIIIVEGTPNASPVAPATPAGYLRIASLLITAATGLGASGVTDERVIFNQSGPSGYDAVVGSGNGATHATLAAAIAAVPVGGRILITSNLALSSTVVVNKNNIQIDVKPGVTLSKSGVALGVQITSDGVRWNGGRFSGFSTAGDKAMQATSAADYSMIRDVRFANCDTEIDDLGTATSISGTVTE